MNVKSSANLHEDLPRKWFDWSGHPPLAVTHKKLAKEWHPSLNGILTPGDSTYGSQEKVWWQCRKCAHPWPAKIADRTICKSGCRACAGKVATAQNNLQLHFPDIAAGWHPKKNGSLQPDQVLPKSGQSVVWRCLADRRHEDWTATIANRTTGSGCPSCAGSRPSANYSLKACFPELAKQWWQERNGELKPTDVTPGSNQVVGWKGPERPEHEWQAPVRNRTKTGKGCGFCHGLRPSVTNTLITQFPEIAGEWHPTLNSKLDLQTIVARSPKKAWWRCFVNSRHEWEARVQDRVQKGSGCRECAGLTPARSTRSSK